jgi:peptidoglycan-N-acetylglucosamine deacetylase
MKTCITVDMEHDCPPFLTTYRGIEEGTPRLVAMLAEEGVAGTFFITGDVARRYPDLMRELVAAGHEIGCHGDTHRPFDTLDWETAREEIGTSTEVLRRYYPVASFRAPNLRFPDRYLPLLEDADYALDSSQAKYKNAYIFGRPMATRLKRVPASTTSSVLRLPRAVRRAVFRRLVEPVVLFVHPWEFVDFRRSTLRLDCRFRTGQIALDCLRDNIRFFARRQATFLRMNEL